MRTVSVTTDQIAQLTSRVNELESKLRMTEANVSALLQLNATQVKLNKQLSDATSKLEGYTKEHAKLHKKENADASAVMRDAVNQAKAAVKNVEALQKRSEEVWEKVISAGLTTGPISVNANLPEPKVEVDVDLKRTGWKLEHKRDSRGLITETVAEPTGA